jgi:Domain of unknown function (DUF1918)
MNTAQPTTRAARIGDTIETRGLHGKPPRRGEIVEVLGAPGHEHYRVKWDEQRESLLYPADGVVIIPRKRSR